MARYSRILSEAAATAAEPPEVVNVESDFVVILAALLCALICVVGLIAVARCAWLRRATGGGAVGTPSTEIANKGVKKKNLQLLPKFTYTAGGGGGEGDGVAATTTTKFASTECAICLGEFVEGEEVRVLPQCGHGFHVGCIDTWLGSHSSCPSCRKILVMARCQKCGQFPAATTSAASCGGDGAAAEMELNTGEGNNTNANANSNNSNQVHSAFLP